MGIGALGFFPLGGGGLHTRDYFGGGGPFSAELLHLV
jgi:hypothetical protein